MAHNVDNREGIIDLIKGVCILFVCFTHYAWEGAERRALLFSWWIDMAVPIFMILSGYVYEKALIRKNINSLSQSYTITEILSKVIRFTVPVLFVYIVTLISDANKHSKIPYDVFKTFLQGGRGQGAYYYPVMMQAIFVLPVIGIIVKRYEEKGLLICLIANVIYEILHVAYNIPVECYRLLMLRYIFVAASGCYIALGKQVPAGIPTAMFCGGFLFLFAYLYLGYKPMCVIHWTGTSFAASMYIIPFVWFLIRKCKWHIAPLELLGKASYNIFVMQMLYYYAVAPVVYTSIASRKVQLLASMGWCVCSGVLFYFIETPFTKMLQRKMIKFFMK